MVSPPTINHVPPPRISSTETMRAHNLGLVLRRVHLERRITRARLADVTGMNRSTVKALVEDLAARRLVTEATGTNAGTPGRPSAVVTPHVEGLVALALEVAVDSLSVATVGLGGRVLRRVVVDRPAERYSARQTLDDLAGAARPELERIAARGWVLAGVGVSVFGVVRSGDGLVHVAPNLGWRDVPVGELLGRALGAAVPVRVGNDADLGALAEHAHGAGAGAGTLIFISSEVGVGGGVIADGRPLHGAAGCGGEVGHMPVNPSGSPCRCGSAGCWETEIGELALLRHAGRGAEAGRRAALERLMADAAAGDARALEGFEAAGRWLGIGLATLTNTLNPERVVLGGLLGRAHPFMAAAVRRELDRRALAPLRDAVEIRTARLAPDSSLLGAGELAMRHVLDDPTLIPRSRP